MQKFFYDLATGHKEGFLAKTLKPLLYLVSLAYGLAVKILKLCYRSNPYRLACKVISVGNITLGGTGKTALVEFIARYLKSQGKNIAVLSRGYKRNITNSQTHLPGGQAGNVTSQQLMGDEPFMLSRKLVGVPVLVDADRIRAAKCAIRDYKVDTVLLDDGFQQWKIAKDLEIVTLDASSPFGNKQLIPAGILREGLASLRRADIIVITKTNINRRTDPIKDYLRKLRCPGKIFESRHKPLGFYNIVEPDKLLPPESFAGKRVTLFSGIGDNASFKKIIMSMGIEPGLTFGFLDHYHYRESDLSRIIRKSKEQNIDTIITTEKDAVRIEDFDIRSGGASIVVLRIGIEITGDEKEFFARLRGLYSD